MNALNYTLQDQCLPSTWQKLMSHLPTKRNMSNTGQDIIKTLNHLREMRKLKLTKVDFKVSYEKQQEKKINNRFLH